MALMEGTAAEHKNIIVKRAFKWFFESRPFRNRFVSKRSTTLGCEIYNRKNNDLTCLEAQRLWGH
jgi:hypothetical protein